MSLWQQIFRKRQQNGGYAHGNAGATGFYEIREESAMNPVDKIVCKAIWSGKKTGIGAVDGLVLELKGMTIRRLFSLYLIGGRTLRRYAVTETLRRISPARRLRGLRR